jgi:hypothetical protein
VEDQYLPPDNIGDSTLKTNLGLTAQLQTAWADTVAGMTADQLTDAEGRAKGLERISPAISAFMARARATVDEEKMRHISFTGPFTTNPEQSCGLKN